MKKQTRDLLIKIILIVAIVCGLGISIYSYIKLEKTKEHIIQNGTDYNIDGTREHLS